MSKISVSILIVNFQSFDKVESLLNSLVVIKGDVNIEILIFNNDLLESESLKNFLSNFDLNFKLFEDNNIGFGRAVNFLSNESSNSNLLILNPDCLFKPSFNLKNFIDKYETEFKNNSIGLWAPQIIDFNGNCEISFGEFPTLIEVLFRTFFIHKVLPKYYNNKYSIGKKFYKNILSKVPYPSGAFFLIKKNIFHGLGGFDERFFAYFEETDLALRLANTGRINLISPEFEVIHYRGNRKQLSVNNKLFIESQYKYFKKHIGYIRTLLFINIVSVILRLPYYGFKISFHLIRIHIRSFKLSNS